MKKLAQLLNFFEKNINESYKQNLKVSKSSIGWHIAHSLKVISVVTDAINQSNSELFKPKISLTKLIVFITGKIPRGKSKAPKITNPNQEIIVTFLQNEIKTTREKLSQLSVTDSNKYFTHPFFGDLKLKSTIRFLNIHTNHHYKLIRDILKN